MSTPIPVPCRLYRCKYCHNIIGDVQAPQWCRVCGTNNRFQEISVITEPRKSDHPDFQ